jgi:hypothetical protein
MFGILVFSSYIYKNLRDNMIVYVENIRKSSSPFQESIGPAYHRELQAHGP